MAVGNYSVFDLQTALQTGMRETDADATVVYDTITSKFTVSNVVSFAPTTIFKVLGFSDASTRTTNIVSNTPAIVIPFEALFIRSNLITNNIDTIDGGDNISDVMVKIPIDC